MHKKESGLEDKFQVQYTDVGAWAGVRTKPMLHMWVGGLGQGAAIPNRTHRILRGFEMLWGNGHLHHPCSELYPSDL
ncbi:hypothetical protein SLA2020_278440 [Shorea laevis]